MEEFENLSIYELRGLLTDRIEETWGRDYLLGWLKAAYRNGHITIDENRDLLIEQIRTYTKGSYDELSISNYPNH